MRVRERLFCSTVSAQLTLAEQVNDWEALTEQTEHNWSREGEDVLAMGGGRAWWCQSEV